MVVGTQKARVNWFSDEMRMLIGLTSATEQIMKTLDLAEPDEEARCLSETTKTTIYVIFIGDHLRFY